VRTETDGDTEGERDCISQQRNGQHLAAQPIEVDLEAGEEQQECDADESENFDRHVNLQPPEQGRPDDDARDNFDDGRRDLEVQRRHRDRRADRDQRNGEQAAERQVLHHSCLLASHTSRRIACQSRSSATSLDAQAGQAVAPTLARGLPRNAHRVSVAA
jgi:hypothetical protein